MPRIWLELKEVHTFIIVYDCEVGLECMVIRCLHLGDLEFIFNLFFLRGTQEAHGHPSSREKMSWLGIKLPTTLVGFGYLSIVIRQFWVIPDL